MSKTGKTILGLIVIVVVVLLIVLGVRGKKTNTPATGEPIKIGFMGPLTGDGAVYGEPFKNIVIMAVDQINASGGINGKPLEVVYEDDKCAGPSAAAAAQKLANVDKVHAILGSMCSSATLTALPITEKAGALLFSPGASSPDLTGKSPLFLRDYPSDASQGTVLASVASGVKKWKKVGVLVESLDYPLGIYRSFNADFEAAGGKTVKEEFQSSNSDFRSMLSKLQSERPDALFIIVQASPAGEKILTQLNELGWKTPLIVNDVIVGDPNLMQKKASVLEGALAAEFPTDLSNTKFQELLSLYKQKYGIDLSYQAYGQTAYDAVFMLADGLRAVGNDGAKLATWLHAQKDWPGASGMVTIGANGDRVGGHVAEVVRNGKVEPYK